MFDAKSLVSEGSSIHRRSIINLDDNEFFELQDRLTKFEREITELKFENSVFESVLERKKSELHVPQTSFLSTSQSTSQVTTPTGSHQDLTSGNVLSRTDRFVRKQSKSRSTQSDIRIKLTPEQKLAIVTAEYELIKNEKLRCEKLNEKNIDQFESDFEWIDVEGEELQTTITELLKLQDVSIDKRTHKVIGEKLAHYFHEHLQAQESATNKLRDRSGALKKQIIRFDSQLKHKEEMGETLLEVDFNQLQIENRQYLDKIDEKNIELVLLKRQVAKVTQTLNRYKDELNSSIADLSAIEQRIVKQDALQQYADKEVVTVSKEQTFAARTNHRLVHQIENYQVPEILEYVRRKSLLSNLQRDCQVWQRKVELASMSLRQSKQQWRELQGAAQFNNLDEL